jgi:hypothetical protein
MLPSVYEDWREVVRCDRRHWPYPWSRLEELAARAEVDPEAVRVWLRAEVEQRRAESPISPQTSSDTVVARPSPDRNPSSPSAANRLEA